jgi:hypothetical protein
MTPVLVNPCPVPGALPHGGPCYVGGWLLIGHGFFSTGPPCLEIGIRESQNFAPEMARRYGGHR